MHFSRGEKVKIVLESADFNSILRKYCEDYVSSRGINLKLFKVEARFEQRINGEPCFRFEASKDDDHSNANMNGGSLECQTPTK